MRAVTVAALPVVKWLSFASPLSATDKSGAGETWPPVAHTSPTLRRRGVGGSVFYQAALLCRKRRAWSWNRFPAKHLETLGGFWGYPDVHDIGNSGKQDAEKVPDRVTC
jgi:hypothetical protein